MSYGQVIKLQYCPIDGHFNFFCRVSSKNAKNEFFLLFGKLLEILILKHISRVPPWESSRPDVSENVVVFGPRSSGMGVIAARSWRTAKFLGPLQKIRGVTKKRHGHNNEFWGLKRIAGPPNHVRRPCYSFQDPQIDIVAVSFFCDTSFPAKKISEFDHTLTANNFGLKPPNLENYHIFGILRSSAFTWSYPGWVIPVQNFE